MAEILKIRGGVPLGGEIRLGGSKNAVLPAIAASLLTKDEVILQNVPEIRDAEIMLELLKDLGAHVQRDLASKTISIRAADISRFKLNAELSGKLRTSLLFSGSLISRFRRAIIPYPGGDKIGARPLTTHLNALRALGVSVTEGDAIDLDGAHFQGSKIVLEEMSVTATENTLLAAVLAPGETNIRLADSSPHIQELVKLLNSMGAKIQWTGPGSLAVQGVDVLHGTTFSIIPDEIEISSFAALAAATHSEITIRGVQFQYYEAGLLQLYKMGVEYRELGSDLIILKARKPYGGFRIQSGIYPKLMSDHLPPFAVLATQASGESLIHEWLYDGRLRYIDELKKMGANATILDPHRALIVGPTPLFGREIPAMDVRSGMTMIIAGLVSEGETILHEVEHVDRGYERIDERLRQIGAKIDRITVN